MRFWRQAAEEHYGRIIPPDEMNIQSDLKENKISKFDELSGLLEVGAKENTCHILRTGKIDKVLGTHALLVVFFGITGLRLPFADISADGIRALELCPLFRRAVDNSLRHFDFKLFTHAEMVPRS